MMDLWATVPYYTAYLSRALLAEQVDLTVGSISYYLDSTCFSSRGIKLDPGLLDVVGKFRLPRLPRRILKFLESVLNLSALTVRFLISPPDVIHVQYLPMLMSPLPLDLWFIELCRRRGSKIVLTVHDLLPHDTGETYKQTFHDLYHMVDGIICHSDTSEQGLRRNSLYRKKKYLSFPTGRSSTTFLQPPRNRPCETSTSSPESCLCCGKELSSPTKESICCWTHGNKWKPMTTMPVW